MTKITYEDAMVMLGVRPETITKFRCVSLGLICSMSPTKAIGNAFRLSDDMKKEEMFCFAFTLAIEMYKLAASKDRQKGLSS